MIYRAAITILLVISSLCYAKPPELTPAEASYKLKQILKDHASYHSLNQEIIKRSFGLYLEEIDPSKTYLLESEVDSWINPSSELLRETLQDANNKSFRNYAVLHSLMEKGIERRAKLEEKIKNAVLPKNVSISEFQDYSWAKTEEELYDRLLKIRSLQIETAEKFIKESPDNLIKRMEKRRFSHEEEVLPSSTSYRQQTVLSYVLKSLSRSLDSQTCYFTPVEAKRFLMQVQQKLFGIGAQLRDDLSGLTIVKILDGSPASKSKKLKINDRVIAVNGQSIIGMDISESVELIQGPEGTPVSLTILRKIDGANPEEEKIEVEIIRGEIILNESRIEVKKEPFDDGVIAHVHLHSFYQDDKSSSAQDIVNGLEILRNQHPIRGVILDLRNNYGGIFDQAIAVCRLFMSRGVVVSIKDNTGKVQHARNLEDGVVWNGPLIVLVNRASASAAEIVAQTLQDYGRAIVVGDDHTYGKGTYQTFTLNSSDLNRINPTGEYKVTRGRYYTASGKSPQLTGVSSDIQVVGILSNTDIGESFSKYPLETDEIASSIHDDLSDISIFHRKLILSLYKSGKQNVESKYTCLLPLLRESSMKRLSANANYQDFLSKLEKKESAKDDSAEEKPNEEIKDLQLEESYNIIKDLISLTEQGNHSSQRDAA